MIRIVVVEEMSLFRGAMCAVLSSEDDLEVLADLGEYRDILTVIDRERPDVVVLDMELSGHDMPAMVGRLVAQTPDSAVLALSSQHSPEVVQETLRAGVRGFVSKDLPPAELIRTIRLVAEDERVIDPAVVVAALKPPVSPLTEREREVLRAAAEGTPLKDIASRLFLAHGTVRNHLSAILRKTGARNRLEAIRRAKRDGWL